MVVHKPLFPTPQRISYGDELTSLACSGKVRCYIAVTPDPSTDEMNAAQLIRERIGAACASWPEIRACRWSAPMEQNPFPIPDAGGLLPILVGEAARPWLDAQPAPQPDTRLGNIARAEITAESYCLQVTPQYIALRGVGGVGTYYAAQTLVKLITVTANDVSVPTVNIADWPDMAWRGLYVESKWGPDRMTKQDWFNLIDHLADMKLNLLGVGIYGTWEIQYDQQITEFLMVPLANRPDLHTKKTIEYYSALKTGWQSLTYLPTMFEEDFFGEVVAYGRTRHVTVRPHFNCLGHNTIIPRLYPHIAAKNAQGWGTGYSLCLSRPDTVPFMSEILCDIARKYLLPNDVDHFHLGMDEVWDQKGIYAHHPQHKVSPWCECAECRSVDKAELITNYILQLALALKACGVKHITVWHDQLNKMGILTEDFVARLKSLGLEDNLILNWWSYSAQLSFQSIKPELGLRNFVTPMTGYYFWSPLRSYYQNIFAMSRLGAEQAAEGMEAYCTHDKAFTGYQLLLADCAWNAAATDDLETWYKKLAHYVFGAASAQGEPALQAFISFTHTGKAQQLLSMLDNYRYTYTDVAQSYPRAFPEEALAWLKSAPNIRENLNEVLEQAEAVYNALLPWRDAAIPQAELLAEWIVEVVRAKGLFQIFTLLLEAEEHLQSLRQAQAEGSVIKAQTAKRKALQSLDRALQTHDSVVLRLERVKDPYLLPQLLRDWCAIRPYIVSLLAAVQS
jgi:hypothetical protein